jgi:hypothetical protein
MTVQAKTSTNLLDRPHSVRESLTLRIVSVTGIGAVTSGSQTLLASKRRPNFRIRKSLERRRNMVMGPFQATKPRMAVLAKAGTNLLDIAFSE